MPSHVYFIRHGQSLGNLQRIYQGQLDYELSHKGTEQAKLLKEILPQEIDRVYSSPLRRAFETAYIAYPEKKEDIIIDPRLMERDLGIFQGKQRDNLDEKERIIWMKLKQEPDFDKHKGETMKEMVGRVSAFIHDLEEILCGNSQKVAIFTHYGVLNIFTNHILNIKREKFHNADPVFFRYDGKWTKL